MGFKTADAIKLQPYDSEYGVAFQFPVASSATSNDGTLPYGTSIYDAVVTGWYNGVEAADLIHSAATLSGVDTVLVSLDYPTTTMSGISRVVNMSLRFILTLDTGPILQEYYNNVLVGDNQ